jgi:hypothetical protein
MDVNFNCPACAQHLTVDQEGAGLTVPCPTCGMSLTVPEAVIPPSNAPFERTSTTGGSGLATSKATSAWPGGSIVLTPLRWILRGITDGLRGTPILFLGLLCALIIYVLSAALLCVGDFLVFGPLLCGMWAMALGILRRESGALGRVFDGFSVFWRAVALGLLWMLIAGAVGLLGWGIFLLNALLLPRVWLLSALVCALVGSYPSWRLGFAAPLLVDRRSQVGDCLAGSWRMTSGLAMHVAWIVFDCFGLGLAAILGVLFVLVTGLFGVGVVQAVKGSQDPSQLMAAFGSTVVVVALLAPLLACVWIAVMLMARAHAYSHTLCRLEERVRADKAGKPEKASPGSGPLPGGRLRCSQCSQPLETGARFCSRCGSLITDPQTQPCEAFQGAPPGQGDTAGGRAAVFPAEAASLAQPLPAAVALAQGQSIYLPGIALYSTGRLELGAPVASAEETFWQGRRCFWFYVPSLARSLLWFLVWCYCASAAAKWFDWITAHGTGDLRRSLLTLEPAVEKYAWVFYVFAALAFVGIVRSIIEYFNTFIVITTQRVRIRSGLLSQSVSQIELFRLKDVALQKSLWGRICNYGHLLLISSDRLMGETTLKGLPAAEEQLEAIRFAAQRARAQSGMVSLTE